MNHISQLLVRAAETQKGITFFKNKNEFYFKPYTDLLDDSRKYAQTLIQSGIRKGVRVAVMLPSDEQFILLFFACLQIGAIPSAIYPPVRLGRLDDWNATLIKQLEAIKPVILLTNEQIKPFLGNKDIYQHLKLGISVPKMSHLGHFETELNDIAFIQFSSGTTGSPKPVYLSHKAVLTNIEQIVETLPPVEDIEHTCCSWLPLYHDMGLVGGMLSSIQQMANLVLIRPEQFLARPVTWFEAITKFKITVTLAPNFAFGLCLKRIDLEKFSELDLSSLMVTMCGAEMVHPKTLKDFGSKFTKIGFNNSSLLPVYGMAEATLAVTFHQGGNRKRWFTFDKEQLESGRAVLSEVGVELASLGMPLRDVQIKIVKEEQTLEDSLVGEVLIKSPSLFTRIDNREAGEWYQTGDLGFIFDGELFIVGRKKDMIIHLGRNIDPTQIERVADNLSAVRKGCSAAVSIYSHEEGKEEIVLFVESDQISEDLQHEIEQEVLGALGLKIRAVIFSPGTIYRTSSGKIQRQKTLQKFLSKELKENKVSIPKILLKRAKGQIYNFIQESRLGK